MKAHGKLGAFALLCTALASGAVSCKDDDPDYDDVTPPVVAVTHNISGRVTSMSGDGLQATVFLDGTSKSTNADGTFVFDDVAEGTHTMKAEAGGMVSKEASVIVNDSDSMNPVWNVALSKEGTAIVVKTDGSADGDTTSETLKGNEKAEIEMTLTAPADAVESASADVRIIVTPTYSMEDAEQTRAETAGSTFLIGTDVSCTDASATLSKPMTLEYHIDPEMAGTVTARKYVNGQWVDAEFTVIGDKVTVEADRFTAYSLLCTAAISTSPSSEELSFTPDSWNNLYGSGDLSVTSASYSYKIGTEIGIADADKFTSYLIEIVARLAGAGFTTATGTYPVNVILPVGTAMSISGRQEVTGITASAQGRSASCKRYGTVSVVAKTWNRQHTGGGSVMGN